MITEFPKEGKLDVNAMHPDTDNNAKKLENFLAKERRFLDKCPEYENVLICFRLLHIQLFNSSSVSKYLVCLCLVVKYIST